MNYSVLESYGINYKKGIERCLNDEEFYEKILILFLDDTSFERAKVAFEAKDYDTLFNCMHELKGACGNAELSELYTAVCPFVEYIRGGALTEAELARLFSCVEEAYLRTKEGLGIALNG